MVVCPHGRGLQSIDLRGLRSPGDLTARGQAPHPAAAEFLSCAVWPGLGNISGRS